MVTVKSIELSHQVMHFFISTCCLFLINGEFVEYASFTTSRITHQPVQGSGGRYQKNTFDHKVARLPSILAKRTQLSLVSLNPVYSSSPGNDTAWSPGYLSSESGIYNTMVEQYNTADYLTGDEINRGNQLQVTDLSFLAERSRAAIKRTALVQAFVDVVVDTPKQTWSRVKTKIFSPKVPKRQMITLVDTTWLKEHEEVVSHERVESLRDAIKEWGAYKLPLLVDARSGAILDGHHRHAVGRAMGLSKLPAILVDYLDDDSITVDVWPECGLDCLTKEEVIDMSLSDGVFPPKTSRHNFVDDLPSINVPLRKLL